MFKKKTLYSDLPRPYDQDAARLVKIVLTVMLSCILLAGCALFIGL